MTGLLAGALVFFTSAAVLVLEILAARLLAPYVGLTLETYTGVIGTVLAGIAVGTWQGGRLADRVDPRRMLGPLLVVGGLLSLATVPVVRALGAAGLAGGSGSVLLLTLAGFFGPAAVLSAVTPTVIKIQLRTLEETGHVVGHLSAVGTTGAIAGTFATGFILVSAAPTTVTITAVGVCLVVAGLAAGWRLSSLAGATLPLAAIAALAGAGLAWGVGDVCDVETTYHCARIETDVDRPGGRLLRLDTLRHSYVDLDDPTHLEFGYTKLFADVIAASFPAGTPIDVLHLGGGGFTMPRWLAAVRPRSTSVVLEIDGGLVDLARRRLGLETGDDLRVRVGDARTLIGEVGDASQDVVLGDAFGGLAVPWHLTTTELVAEVERVLRPDGIYAMNIIDHPPLRFVRAEVATLRDRFDHVAVMGPPARLRQRDGGNFVLVAADRPIDAAAVQALIDGRDGDERVITGEGAASFAGGAPILRDDHAPVDQWMTTRRAR